MKLQLRNGLILTCSSLDDVTPEQAKQVDMIDAYRCNLEYVFVSRFRNLEILIVNSNHLKIFPDLHYNKKLRYLQIYSNDFTFINPKSLPRGIKEVVIDDLGCRLYPIVSLCSTKIYYGYGRFYSFDVNGLLYMRYDYIDFAESLQYYAEQKIEMDIKYYNPQAQTINQEGQWAVKNNSSIIPEISLSKNQSNISMDKPNGLKNRSLSLVIDE